jgi:hypothetical protein
MYKEKNMQGGSMRMRLELGNDKRGERDSWRLDG